MQNLQHYSFHNAGHVRMKPGHNNARLINPDGEEPAKEVNHLNRVLKYTSFEYGQSLSEKSQP